MAKAKHVCIEADRKRVQELSDKLVPIINGYSANEIAHAFLMTQFKVGLAVGEASAPVFVVTDGDILGGLDAPSAKEKGKKNGKAYIN